MTTVAIHQPQYLPWVPYCDKADACDIFVFLDTVQFQRGGVQNRNSIKTPTGELLLTVPVKANRESLIKDVDIAGTDWQKKHISGILRNYARAPYFHLFTKELKPILEKPWSRLADLNIEVTRWMFGIFGIKARLVRASELNLGGAKEELIINICRALNATRYLSGQGAKAYQSENRFLEAGIQLEYQIYHNQPYKQLHDNAGLLLNLSALDLILNEGPEGRNVMLAGRKSSTNQSGAKTI